jgi:hypothetical protein
LLRIVAACLINLAAITLVAARPAPAEAQKPRIQTDSTYDRITDRSQFVARTETFATSDLRIRAYARYVMCEPSTFDCPQKAIVLRYSSGTNPSALELRRWAAMDTFCAYYLIAYADGAEQRRMECAGGVIGRTEAGVLFRIAPLVLEQDAWAEFLAASSVDMRAEGIEFTIPPALLSAMRELDAYLHRREAAARGPLGTPR